MRLLEEKSLRMALEHGDVVFEQALRVGVGSARDGIANHRVQRITPAERLLDEAVCEERLERATGGPHPREATERLLVGVISLDVREDAEETAARLGKALPRPVHE
jgi:hypothetical protein